MREWRRSSLRQIVGAPMSGKRPSGGVNAETDGIPSLGGENIRAQGGMVYETINRIPISFFRSMPKGRLQLGDVLINKDGAQTGKVGIYDGRFQEAAVNEHLFILRSSNGAIDQRLLYYYLLLPTTQRNIARRITGSAQPGLNSQFVDAVHLSFPADRVEQQQIAEILATIDEAIEQTEALIAKTQQIKAGLMHDLFTRGVTPDGQLRPPREEAPKLYKDSPLGWIPKDWDVVPVDALCSQVVDCPHSTPTYIAYGIPCIRTADMLPGELLIEQAYRVSEDSYVERVARLIPRAGDVIYSREGERLGIASPVGDERVCLGQRVMLLRPSPKTDPSFMLWAMNAPSFYRRVVSGLGATTSPHVNVGDIRKQKILRPAPSEQEAIGYTLSLQQRTLQAETAQRKKYQSMRVGLIHDLLTGHVRVPVANVAEAMGVAANV